MPELYKDKVIRTPSLEEDAKVADAIKRRKKFDEGKAKAQGAYKQILKEGAMKRSYTSDEITVAQLLKGYPMAQEILDELNKGKKNESGEVFQDGSEDTKGSDDHASVARPGTIKHEGGGDGPDNPGTKTEDENEPNEASFRRSEGDDNDLEKSDEVEDVEKSDNLTDNLPEEFEDEMEDDDTIPPEKNTKKSLTADELTLGHLLKTMGSERLEEIMKAADPKYTTGGALSSSKKPPTPDVKANAKALQERLAAKDSSKKKAIEDQDLQRSEDDDDDDDTDTEKSLGGDEQMEENEFSLEFSKSILEGLGLLEKGSPSVSKKVSGGKATQISYSSKPETRFKHPKQKIGETRFEHNVKEGTVTKKEATSEKGKFKEGKPIGVNEEAKLKNASTSSPDLMKSLDSILEKKTSR